MGSITGGGSAKRAALAQAAALDRQTQMQTLQTGYEVEAMAQMMANTQAQQVATEYAERLLSRPMETVEVTLGTSDLDLRTDDLIGRRRTTRQQYQRPTPTAQSRLTQQNALL